MELTTEMQDAIASAVNATTVGNFGTSPPTTELDSHANMVVVGKQATVISRSNSYADVKAFSDDCNKLEKVPIVDAAFAYDCPHTMKTYIMIVRNALLVKSMANNLIPPFIMREAGHIVNDIPKIHCGDEATSSSHCILPRGHNELKIPLLLKGIFSYFHTRSLTQDELERCDEMEAVCLTPDTREWNPTSEIWAEEESKYTDHEGELILPGPEKNKNKEESSKDWIDLNVSSSQWENAIDTTLDANDMTFITEDEDIEWKDNVDSDDPIRAHICDLTGAFDTDLFAQLTEEGLRDSKFQMAVGSTTATNIKRSHENEIFVKPEASSSYASLGKSITKEHLSKVWG